MTEPRSEGANPGGGSTLELGLFAEVNSIWLKLISPAQQSYRSFASPQLRQLGITPTPDLSAPVEML